MTTGWEPPPPGSDRDKLPDSVLALLVLRPYLSTACETAHRIESAMIRHPGNMELPLWRVRMHNRCRLTHKFTMRPCTCTCHHQKGRENGSEKDVFLRTDGEPAEGRAA